MIKPNNVTAGVVVFVLITTLFVSLYTNFEDIYGITRDSTSSANCPSVQQGISIPEYCTDQTMTVMEALEATVSISGVIDVVEAIEQFSVPGNILQRSFEVLTGAGLGIIKIFLGFVVLPGQIANVILLYYKLPSFATLLIATIFNIYIVFIMLRYMLKME